MTRKNGFNLVGVLTLLVVLASALAAAGCTSGSNGSSSTHAPTSVGTKSVTTSVTASGTTGSGAAGPAVSFDRLLPFLPKTAGAWSLDGKGEGMTL